MSYREPRLKWESVLTELLYNSSKEKDRETHEKAHLQFTTSYFDDTGDGSIIPWGSFPSSGTGKVNNTLGVGGYGFLQDYYSYEDYYDYYGYNYHNYRGGYDDPYYGYNDFQARGRGPRGRASLVRGRGGAGVPRGRAGFSQRSGPQP